MTAHVFSECWLTITRCLHGVVAVLSIVFVLAFLLPFVSQILFTRSVGWVVLLSHPDLHETLGT